MLRVWRRPVGIAGLCFRVVGFFERKRARLEQRAATTRHPFERTKSFLFYFFFLLPLPVLKPCSRASEGNAQTLQGPTAAGRACTTRAGAKERAKSSTAHAEEAIVDAFFAGFAPARTASSSWRFPLACREQIVEPVSREAFRAKKVRELGSKRSKRLTGRARERSETFFLFF